VIQWLQQASAAKDRYITCVCNLRARVKSFATLGGFSPKIFAPSLGHALTTRALLALRSFVIYSRFKTLFHLPLFAP